MTNYQLRLRHRRSKGNAIAEMPPAIWLFLVGMLFPFIAMVTLTYRVILLYNGVRDCCYQAALQPSFSEAQLKATQVLTRDAGAFTGITVSPGEPRLRIVIKNLASGAESESPNALAPGSVNPQTNNYFLRTYVNAQVEPLINVGATGFWSGVPGLTGPIQLKDMVYQVYAENPTGLES
jgi:hypothetical protein